MCFSTSVHRSGEWRKVQHNIINVQFSETISILLFTKATLSMTFTSISKGFACGEVRFSISSTVDRTTAINFVTSDIVKLSGSVYVIYTPSLPPGGPRMSSSVLLLGYRLDDQRFTAGARNFSLLWSVQSVCIPASLFWWQVLLKWLETECDR